MMLYGTQNLDGSWTGIGYVKEGEMATIEAICDCCGTSFSETGYCNHQGVYCSLTCKEQGPKCAHLYAYRGMESYRWSFDRESWERTNNAPLPDKRINLIREYQDYHTYYCQKCLHVEYRSA